MATMTRQNYKVYITRHKRWWGLKRPLWEAHVYRPDEHEPFMVLTTHNDTILDRTLASIAKVYNVDMNRTYR